MPTSHPIPSGALLCVLGLLPGLLMACGDQGASLDTGCGPDTAACGEEPEPVPFALSTTAFADGDPVPLRYECGGTVVEGPGENISPDFAWTEGPEGTKSYALIMDDVDSGVVHWVVYDIRPKARGLDEDLPAVYELSDPAGAKQAELQGTGYHGYFGPCSEFSTNTYRWTLHAMSEATVTGATVGTSEYDMVPLIKAESLEATRLKGES